MADQKNNDTKTPFARRGARPFGGPQGAPAPSHPFSRPATGQRPTAAPFVAPVLPGKLVPRNAAPAPAAKLPTPIAPPAISSADIDSTLIPTRPVTGEIVALDAIDAFDAVWGVPEPSGRPVEPAPVAAPLDALSLGSGSESTDSAAACTTPAWIEDDTAPSAVPTPESVESEVTLAVNDGPPAPALQPVADVTGGYGFGEWTDSHTIPAFDEIMGVTPEEPVAPNPEPLGAAPPAQADWTGEEPPGAAEPAPRFELVEPSQEPPPVNREEPEPIGATTPPTADAYSPHEARIAATFDRLADGVRSGEIDVSSIAPEATDAAVLASVLVALLGGSRSR